MQHRQHREHGSTKEKLNPRVLKRSNRMDNRYTSPARSWTSSPPPTRPRRSRSPGTSRGCAVYDKIQYICYILLIYQRYNLSISASPGTAVSLLQLPPNMTASDCALIALQLYSSGLKAPKMSLSHKCRKRQSHANGLSHTVQGQTPKFATSSSSYCHFHRAHMDPP
jgi:hypothetical protein